MCIIAQVSYSRKGETSYFRQASEGEQTYPAKVSNANLDGHACGALVAPGEVIREPGDHAGKRRVDRAGGQEDAAVDDARVGRRDAHGKAHQHEAEKGDDKGAALADPVREVGEYDG